MATMTTTTMNRLSGTGWRVLERPRVPHEELEAFAREVWRLAFHAIPWPVGWHVRWAALTNAIGMCPYEARLLLVDEVINRSPDEIVEVLVHEMAHLHHGGEWSETSNHGPRFQETCDRATAFVLAQLQPGPAIAEPTTASPEEAWEYR